MASCLFRNTAEIDKADMSSALVLLGLTPTVLGQIGPTIKAKAQLGFQSPVLGLLCLLGAPSIAFEKLWVDPSVAIKEPSAKSPYELDSMSSQARWKIWAIHLLKYLFSAGAMVNVFHAAFTLGQQTITSWKCTYWYLELIWVSTTIAPILFGVAAVWNESRSPESYSEGRAMWSRIFYSLSNILAAVQVFFRDGVAFFGPFYWNAGRVGGSRTVNGFSPCLSIYHSVGVRAHGELKCPSQKCPSRAYVLGRMLFFLSAHPQISQLKLSQVALCYRSDSHMARSS